MNYKKKLQEMKANELKDINGKLEIPGAKKLKKEELLKAILKYPEKEIKKALKSDLKTYGNDHYYVARGWNYLGLGWLGYGKNEKALRILKITLGEEHPNTQQTIKNLEIARKKKK